MDYLVVLIVYCLFPLFTIPISRAQTEGDMGYDYGDAYDQDYEVNEALGRVPSFDVPIVNVTVVSGQTALLPCSIEFLGKYKVVWLDQHNMALTYEDRRVIDDSRFTIIRPYLKEWNLQIRDVRWEDQGAYRCTINTMPVSSKLVMLHVKVPAEIIDELSSNDVTVQEGETVVLICNVTGVPRPEVTWYRRRADSKLSDREEVGFTGEMVIIQNVSRYCDDYYECVASNGVPPSVSRQMRVTVEFAPEITMPNNRIGQHLSKETILECIITAFPQAVSYWEKDGSRIMGSEQRSIEVYNEGEHTIALNLRLNGVGKSDYGRYTCVAANALGRDEESMWLHELLLKEQSHSTVLPPVVIADRSSAAPTPRLWPSETHPTPHVIYIQNKSKEPSKGRVTASHACAMRSSGTSILLMLFLAFTYSQYAAHS